MWFPLALTAMLMLVVRRSTEKSLTGRISASSMAWLQQLVALPFLGLALFLPMVTLFNPLQLSAQFYWILAVYVVFGVIDIILYFKAIATGDISVIASLLSLVIVSNLIGTFVFLDQVPSTLGIVGSACILAGAYFASRRLPSTDEITNKAHKLAYLLILIIVALRGLYSPLEVLAIRETDPFYFGFVSMLFNVPLTMLLVWLWGRRNGTPLIGAQLMQTIKKHQLGFWIIGITWAINIVCTYAGKLVADNAAYVTTIKSASVLPMMILGVVLFSEKVRKRQWLGLAFILAGLVLFSQA